MLRFDHEKGVTLLQELTKKPDQNLADAAKARLLKAQMIGKPLDLQFTALDGSVCRSAGATRKDRPGRLLGIVVPGLHSGDAGCSTDLPKIQR